MPALRLRMYILERDGFRCVYCGAEPARVYLHVDHVVPRAQGGETHPRNLVTTCGPCNEGKSDRVLATLPPGLRERLDREQGFTFAQLRRPA